MQFHISSINSAKVLTRASAEAALIAERDQSRSLEQITETCVYGQNAEQYLIEYEGFQNNSAPYQDLLLDGVPYEIKVTSKEHYVPFVLKRCNEAAQQPWRNYPKNLMVFVSENGEDYTLVSEYVWDEGKKCFKIKKHQDDL